MSKPSPVSSSSARQPVIAILGHVDHGKSSLLDYIRKSNVVDGEAGGITQRISAYEVDVHGKKLTFLDTPGHEAFQNMRERGVEIADIAVLVVSAEDGVKAQTLQAYKAIADSKLPYIVAINKIDKSGADVERTKMNLSENGIYLEGMGGDIPFVAISAKVGTGVTELLENITLLADLNEFTYNSNTEATGRVLESFIDAKRGISATLVIKDGVLPSSGSILAGVAMSPIRIIEDFLGKAIKSPHAGQPILVTGFDAVPVAGTIFISSSDKKSIEKLQSEEIENTKKVILDPKLYRNARVVVPVVLRADSIGTLEAVKYEIKKLESEHVKIKIIREGVGNISEGDIMQASGDEKTVILGFTVNIESKAREQADRFNIKPETFDIIYKLSERFAEIVNDRLPYEEVENEIANLKVLKTFSQNKDVHVIGARVNTGTLKDGVQVKIMRRDFHIGNGKVIGLQSMKMKAEEIFEGNECGVEIETKHEIIPGDVLVAFEIERKKI
jgi:translation initiation factor IF-2